jgi:uncharacterized membrane protein
MDRLRASAPVALACIFGVSGVLHIVRPSLFDALVPRVFPGRTHRPVIYASGAAELMCAAGLIRRRQWAPAASSALLVAVLPANLQMALDAGSGRHPGAMDSSLVAWGRIPLQLPLLWAARQARPTPR